VAVGQINGQGESILEAQPIEIGIISRAFVSLKRVPRLVVDTVLLFRVRAA